MDSSRRFAALQKLVANGRTADIRQVAPHPQQGGRGTDLESIVRSTSHGCGQLPATLVGKKLVGGSRCSSCASQETVLAARAKRAHVVLSTAAREQYQWFAICRAHVEFGKPQLRAASGALAHDDIRLSWCGSSGAKALPQGPMGRGLRDLGSALALSGAPGEGRRSLVGTEPPPDLLRKSTPLGRGVSNPWTDRFNQNSSRSSRSKVDPRSRQHAADTGQLHYEPTRPPSNWRPIRMLHRPSPPPSDAFRPRRHCRRKQA